MFKDTKEGETNYCQACEAEAKYDRRSYLHTCGKSNEREELENKK